MSFLDTPRPRSAYSMMDGFDVNGWEAEKAEAVTLMH